MTLRNKMLWYSPDVGVTLSSNRREMAEIHELHVGLLLARMDAQDPTMISERLGYRAIARPSKR
jgi:hypothetical protein